MKCLVISPCDDQQQYSEDEEHNDAVELLKFRDINNHCLDNCHCKQDQRGPAYRTSTANESHCGKRSCVNGPQDRERHLAQPPLMSSVPGFSLRKRERREICVSLN